MKCRKSLKLGGFVLTGLLATAPVASAIADVSVTELPPKQTQGTVTFMNGGIGHDEALSMRKEEGRFPLSLEFIKHAKPVDEALADVDLTITDSHGRTALQTLASGPYLLADLPDGKYRIDADLNGQTKTRDVVIAARNPEHIVFEW